jgi:tetratricopeptide (TPR) repeat protein
MSWGKSLAAVLTLAALAAPAFAGDAEDCRNDKLKATRIEACSRLIAAHPSRDEDLAKLFDLRAAAHSDNDDPSAAADDLGVALRMRPPSAGALVNRGAVYFRGGDTEAALKDFNDATVLDPKNAAARLWRGRAYRKLQQFDNAQADLDAAVTLDPKDPNVWLVRGLLRDDQKRFADAIKDYDQSAVLAPDSVWPIYNRAWSKIQLNRHKEALADLDACHKLNPELADCFDLRGDALAALDDHKGAFAAYSQAIARDPQTARLYKSRAASARKGGDFDGAIRDLTKAFELDTDFETLYDRGWLYSISGRPDNAIADYSLILRREGADAWPSALIERGLARVVRGDLKAAEDDFASARAVAPTSVRAALWRAALNIRLNRDSFWASWRRSDAAAALAQQRPKFKAEKYEAPFVQAILGERGVAEANRVAHIAAKKAEDPQDAACFADAMAGALALAEGDAKGAETYFAKAAARAYPASYSCMIATAELNRIRNR